MASGPFRWAIFGTGPVARKFAYGLRAIGPRAALVRVASRQKKRAEEFAKYFPGCAAADSYEDAIGEDVDAVYIATPPALHASQAILALEAGCAVLVEKPFTLSAQDAKEVVEAAGRADKTCIEAMWTRFLPVTDAIKRRIDERAFGEVVGFEGSFRGANRPDTESSLFNPEDGGALLHRGVYPLSLARHFMGSISKVTASGRIGEAGADEEVSLTLTHASGAISSIQASLLTTGPNDCRIFGTQGTLSFGPVWRPSRASIAVTTPSAPQRYSRPRRLEGFRESRFGQNHLGPAIASLKALRRSGVGLNTAFLGNGYSHEALAMMDAMEQGRLDDPRMPLSQSIEIMEVLDEARLQLRRALE